MTAACHSIKFSFGETDGDFETSLFGCVQGYTVLLHVKEYLHHMLTFLDSPYPDGGFDVAVYRAEPDHLVVCRPEDMERRQKAKLAGEPVPNIDCLAIPYQDIIEMHVY